MISRGEEEGRGHLAVLVEGGEGLDLHAAEADEEGGEDQAVEEARPAEEFTAAGGEEPAVSLEAEGCVGAQAGEGVEAGSGDDLRPRSRWGEGEIQRGVKVRSRVGGR